MGSLILISCSDKKREGGDPYPVGSDPVPWLKDQGLRQRLFDTRAKVFKLIKEDRLEDSEKKQGKRGWDLTRAPVLAHFVSSFFNAAFDPSQYFGVLLSKLLSTTSS